MSKPILSKHDPELRERKHKQRNKKLWEEDFELCDDGKNLKLNIYFEEVI